MKIKQMNALTTAIALALGLLVTACGTGSGEKGNPTFFTSGNREADQRAEQRVAKAQQLKGKGQGASEAQRPPEAKPLYDRLGGDAGIQKIIDDFVPRVLADPRVNWKRQDVRRGGVLGVGRHAQEWDANDEHVTALKTHLRQFIAVATGGPTDYDGKEIKSAHQGMRITNVEFDASVGDVKASLDKRNIGIAEQKELLAIIESTRLQIVEQR